jgi:ubiquinone/menaquinone biosynthesis C-methylase UbiE
MQDSEKFYNKLIINKDNKTFFSFNDRFEQNKILRNKNIKTNFDKVIKKFIADNDAVLDYGCGTGAFTYKISKFTKKKVFGVDLSKEFIKCSKKFFKNKTNKLIFKKIDGIKTNFDTGQFDKILMVDVIHHLESIDTVFKELKRILKKDGKILVYEPNLLNPLIFVIHLIDKNENGLLKVGIENRYKEICKRHQMKIEHFSFNGIVISQYSIFFEIISKLLNYPFFSKFLNWLKPKVFFIIKNI